MSNNTELNKDTIELLSQINAGCKMAIDSLEQVGKYVDDKRLIDIIKKYNEAHIKIEDTSHQMLNYAGQEGQEPGLLAKTFAQMQAKIKLLMKDDVHQAASILTDGCNMGIKSLCEYKNSYKTADAKSVKLCEDLCDLEGQMLVELQPLL
jgi:hypothetical protein